MIDLHVHTTHSDGQLKIAQMLGYNFEWRKLNKSKIIDRSTKEEKMEKERKHLEFLKEICKELHIKIDDNIDIKSPNEKASIRTDSIYKKILQNFLPYQHFLC